MSVIVRDIVSFCSHHVLPVKKKEIPLRLYMYFILLLNSITSSGIWESSL